MPAGPRLQFRELIWNNAECGIEEFGLWNVEYGFRFQVSGVRFQGTDDRGRMTDLRMCKWVLRSSEFRFLLFSVLFPLSSVICLLTPDT